MARDIGRGSERVDALRALDATEASDGPKDRLRRAYAKGEDAARDAGGQNARNRARAAAYERGGRRGA